MPKNESLLDKAFRRFGLEQRSGQAALERRNSLENPQTPLSFPAEWMLDAWNGSRTDSGIRVSEVNALQASTVFQCVTIIANGVSSNPLHVYERLMEDGRTGKKIAYNHPLYRFLNCRPNIEMTSASWRRTMQCHKLLWGNAYSEIEYDGAGRVKAIWPRNPARTRPVRITEGLTMQGTFYPAGTMVYETYDPIGEYNVLYQDNNNQQYGYRRVVLAEDMIHLVGLSLDGRIGSDVINMARQAIGLALAAEKYGAKFFGNGAVPNGLLSVPGDMTDIQWETLKRSWSEAHGGENSHKTGVLPPGVKYEKTGATPEEGQMLETRQHQRLEIASYFNVPGHMIGVITDDAGKSSVEQSSIEFKLFCLDPHINDWEQELAYKLFPSVGQAANKYFAGFDTRKLMYPDAKSRSTFYGSGKQWGYLNTNEIHELEGMNPATDGSGDKYWMPNNMVDAAAAATHSDAVIDGLEDGTLAATPSNVTPVGSHPVVKDEQKAAKAANDVALQKHEMSTKASVAIAKHNASGKQQDQGDDNEAGQKAQVAQKAKAKKKAKRSQAEAVFSKMYRDACGRAAHRNKATKGDYLTIFAPVMSAMIEMIHDEERVDARQFIDDYLADLFERRNGKWEEEKLDADSASEFGALAELVLQ